MNEVIFLLFKIKQAICKKKKKFYIKKNILYVPFLYFLLKKNFIQNFVVNKVTIIVYLNYDIFGKSIIHDVNLLSLKSRKKHISYKQLFLYNIGFRNIILLTAKGYLTHQEAINNKLGGILICSIY